MTTTTEILSIIRRAGMKPYRYSDRFLGKCGQCGEAVRRHRSQFKVESQHLDAVTVRCRVNGCMTKVKVAAVRWTLTEKPHECDARCVGAKGTKCECECGGENHGAASL